MREKMTKTFALDIDSTVLDFTKAFVNECKKHFLSIKIGKVWNFFDEYPECYEIFKNLPEEFWLNIPILDKARDLSITPTAYISHRKFDVEITKQSLKNVGLPEAPVYHVDNTEDKIKIIKQLGVDVYVDDRASTVLYCIENSIEAYCLEQIWNEGYSLPSIKTLGELNRLCQ